MVLAVAAFVLVQRPAIEFRPIKVPLYDRTTLDAEIGTFKVPENRQRKDSRLIELAVVRIKCTGPNPGTPIVYLSGGPGLAASSESWQPAWLTLRKAHDILLLDQRGLGHSKPNNYWSKPVSPPLDCFLSQRSMLSWIRSRHTEAVKALKAQGFDLHGYNVVESADDVAALREALALPKVNILGFSYGTHLGLSVLRRHPGMIENAVLIGTEGQADTNKLPSTYDTQMKKLSDLAAESPAVREKVPNMLALFKELLDQLDQKPMVVEIQDRLAKKRVKIPVGRFGLQMVVRFDIGDGFDYIEFPLLFHTIKQGDPSILAKYVEKRYNAFGGGVSGMATMTDMYSGTSPDRMARIKREYKDSLLGETVNFMYDRLEDIWGKPDLGEAFRSPFNSNVRTLFVSGTLDSNTPPYQAEIVRWGFRNSNHLIVEYAGHEDMFMNDLIIAQIDRFLNGMEIETSSISLGKPKFKPIP